MDSDCFCPSQLARVRRRVERVRASRGSYKNSPKSCGSPFTMDCEVGKALGCDNVPYEAFLVRLIGGRLHYTISWKCVVSTAVFHPLWKHGIVATLAKGAGSSDRSNYRPITLAPCLPNCWKN